MTCGEPTCFFDSSTVLSNCVAMAVIAGNDRPRHFRESSLGIRGLASKMVRLSTQQQSVQCRNVCRVAVSESLHFSICARFCLS
jgi:hypothetical protein